MESDETHQNENNPFDALYGIDDEDEDDDIVPEHKTIRTRSRHPPQSYQPNFENNRYDDSSEQIHIQVDDVTKVKFP